MTPCRLVPIGHVTRTANGPGLEIEPAYREGLLGLDDFRWIVVHWFADRSGEGPLVLPAPYRGAPERLGVFATRSPLRPNPLCVTVAALGGVDVAAGLLHINWIDCDDGTPVLDVKPYQPSLDRVESPEMPAWCAGWPRSVETSGAFDWASTFTH
jgi:tRNA-Thr(GGU) m(6)t(6)A37 methyltransferase TsaA